MSNATRSERLGVRTSLTLPARYVNEPEALATDTAFLDGAENVEEQAVGIGVVEAIFLIEERLGISLLDQLESSPPIIDLDDLCRTVRDAVDLQQIDLGFPSERERNSSLQETVFEIVAEITGVPQEQLQPRMLIDELPFD